MLGSTVFILFIMLVATANLCLGFAAAVAFGLGPKQWPVMESHIAAHDHAGESSAASHSPVPSVQATAKDHAPAATVAAHAPPQPASSSPKVAEAPVVTLAERMEALTRTFDLCEAELADWDQRRHAGEVDIDNLTSAAIELNTLASGYIEQFQSRLESLDNTTDSDAESELARQEIRDSVAQLEQQLRVSCAELGSLQFEQGDSEAAQAKLTTALSEMQAVLAAARRQLQEPLAALGLV